jgi:S-sulfo-L-cysteine synthase (3-phospho-L-serine-dependent)
MTHVLFLEMSRTGAGVAYLEAARALGFEATFVTFDPDYYRPAGTGATPVLAGVDHLLTVDTHSDVEVLWEAVAGHARTRPIDAVLASMDLELYQAAVLAERLGVPGVAPEAVRTCRDKSRTRAVLARAGVPSARYRVAADADAAVEAAARIGYPCVCKPLDGHGSEGVVLVGGPAEVREAVGRHQADLRYWRGTTRSPAVLVEEFLAGPLVSVESVATSEGRIVLGVTDRTLGPEPHFAELRDGFPACRADGAEIVAVAEQALAAVGWDFGPSHTELVVTADGPRVVEVNPRLIGSTTSLVINACLGIDVHAGVLRLHAGLEHGIAPRPQGAGNVHEIVAPRTGRLDAIAGLDELAACDGVLEWQVRKRPGDRVTARPTQNNETLGHLSVVGVDADQAWERLEVALGRLTVVVDGQPSRPPVFGPASATSAR